MVVTPNFTVWAAVDTRVFAGVSMVQVIPSAAAVAATVIEL